MNRSARKSKKRAIRKIKECGTLVRARACLHIGFRGTATVRDGAVYGAGRAGALDLPPTRCARARHSLLECDDVRAR
jgi:hypothetical protein